MHIDQNVPEGAPVKVNISGYESPAVHAAIKLVQDTHLRCPMGKRCVSVVVGGGGGGYGGGYGQQPHRRGVGRRWPWGYREEGEGIRRTRSRHTYGPGGGPGRGGGGQDGGGNRQVWRSRRRWSTSAALVAEAGGSARGDPPGRPPPGWRSTYASDWLLLTVTIHCWPRDCEHSGSGLCGGATLSRHIMGKMRLTAGVAAAGGQYVQCASVHRLPPMRTPSSRVHFHDVFCSFSVTTWPSISTNWRSCHGIVYFSLSLHSTVLFECAPSPSIFLAFARYRGGLSPIRDIRPAFDGYILG